MAQVRHRQVTQRGRRRAQVNAGVEEDLDYADPGQRPRLDMLDLAAQGEEALESRANVAFHLQRGHPGIKRGHHDGRNVQRWKHVHRHPRERVEAEDSDDQRPDDYRVRVAKRKRRHSFSSTMVQDARARHDLRSFRRSWRRAAAGEMRCLGGRQSPGFRRRRHGTLRRSLNRRAGGRCIERCRTRRIAQSKVVGRLEDRPTMRRESLFRATPGGNHGFNNGAMIRTRTALPCVARTSRPDRGKICAPWPTR